MNFNKRKLKYASVSTIFIVAVVVMAILANVLVGVLSDRFSLQLDLSPEGGYSISEDTTEFLKTIDEDVHIYVLKHQNLVEASESGVRLVENLARYGTTTNGRISYEFVDPNVQVTFYDKFPDATKVQDAFLIVESEKRYVTIPESELKVQYGTDESTLRPDQFYFIESSLNTALLRVLSDKVSKVAVTTGHNETTLDGFNNIFAGNGFETVTVNLLTQDIPEDVNNLLIAGPYTDFAAAEIAKIDRFLAKDGHNLYLFWAPTAGNLEVLDRYLTEWGLKVENQIILDQQYTLGMEGDLSGVFAFPTENELITVLPSVNQQMLVSPTSQPITILWEEGNDRRVVSLAESFESSYAKTINETLSLGAAQEASDAKGPFTVVAVSETMVSPVSEELPSRVFLISSTYFAMNEILDANFTLNNSFLNELVSYGNPNTETMEIAPVVVESNMDLNLKKSTVDILFWVLVVVIPSLILAAGIYVFIRRRHR